MMLFDTMEGQLLSVMSYHIIIELTASRSPTCNGYGNGVLALSHEPHLPALARQDMHILIGVCPMH